MATKSIRLSDGTDTLLPESAQSASGYQKCADGTLIEYGQVVWEANTWNKVIDMPIPMADNNYSMTAHAHRNDSSPWYTQVPNLICVHRQEKNQFAVYNAAGATNITIEHLITWIAIGRWK